MPVNEIKDGLNNSITKAVALLNSFSYDQPRLRLKEISAMTGVNPATAHRMLNTLKELNLIEHTEGVYSLGRGFLKYEGIVLNSMEIRRIGLAYLEELTNNLRVNVNLAVLDDKEVVYVARAETPHCTYGYFHIGMRRPIHCTALDRSKLEDETVRLKAEAEEKEAKLYQEIGQLATQLAWLKKI